MFKGGTSVRYRGVSHVVAYQSSTRLALPESGSPPTDGHGNDGAVTWSRQGYVSWIVTLPELLRKSEKLVRTDRCLTVDDHGFVDSG